MQRRHLFKVLAGLGLGFLLLTSILAQPVLAGRYVLNQTPQRIQLYFGSPWTRLTTNEQVTYTYSPAGIRRIFPNFPKQGTFKIDFMNNRAQFIRIEPNASAEEERFDYGQAEAAKFFNYIFGYQPPIWKPIPLPFGGGGHEGFGESKACLGDGVANFYIEYRLGLMESHLYYDTACEPPYKP